METMYQFYTLYLCPLIKNLIIFHLAPASSLFFYQTEFFLVFPIHSHNSSIARKTSMSYQARGLYVSDDGGNL